MAATLERRPEDRDLENRLDELIPPTADPIKTLAISATVVGAAVAVTVLTIGGYVYPRPTFGASFSSGSYLEVDRGRDAISATVILPNYGNRSVRVTDIAFDAEGAEMVDSGAYLEPPYETEPSNSGGEASAATPAVSRNESVLPLPLVVPAGRTATIVVWFRPTQCVDQPGPWGSVDATVDFGDGAFPPFSNTVHLAQDAIVVVDPDASPESGGEMTMLREADGSFSMVSGPLAAACEALR